MVFLVTKYSWDVVALMGGTGSHPKQKSSFILPGSQGEDGTRVGKRGEVEELLKQSAKQCTMHTHFLMASRNEFKQ